MAAKALPAAEFARIRFALRPRIPANAASGDLNLPLAKAATPGTNATVAPFGPGYGQDEKVPQLRAVSFTHSILGAASKPGDFDD